MTPQDDQTTSSFDASSGGDDGSGTADQLAAQTGAMAQTPSAVDGSKGDLADSPADGETGAPDENSAGVDGSDSGRGNLDGSAAHEDVRARSLSNSQDSVGYTDSGEAGADSGSME